MMIFSILYGIILFGTLALCTTAKEADEQMEEEMKYIEAQKRLEAYQIKN